ncbi:MFS transporter fmqE like protein [Verticillium longisporum]|nr:MFS transporter fmqE like protein [Verticillium longisporum]
MSDLFDKGRYFNRTLFLSVFLIAVSSFTYGFDNQAFATTQAMEYSTKQFGEYDTVKRNYVLPPSWLSLFNSLNHTGFAAGVIIGSLISSRFGRRWCMFVMSIYALGTATIAVTSNSKDQIMAARILNYVYVVPAPVRGFVVGTYQLSLVVGGLPINSICYGTSKIDDNRSWRIPLGLFYIVPSIVAALIFLVPESPRWLLRQNRPEEAKAMLVRLRQGAFTTEEVEAEFLELRLALESEEKGKFVEVFCGKKRPADRHRRWLLFSLINSAINVITNSGTLLLTDKLGRRTLLMISSVAMMGCLLSMGSLGIQVPVSTARMKGIMALISLFGVSFSLGWAPLTYVVATEVSALHLRDHTSRVGFTVNVVFNFLVNFSIPYLVWPENAGLGSKVGFIFGSIAFCSLVFTYFCVPECKGKTLEQVDYLFKTGVGLRHFVDADVSGLLESNQGLQRKEEHQSDVERGPSFVAYQKDAK